MTKKQIKQFNDMRIALIQIHKEFMTPKQIAKNSEHSGLHYEEYLEMAYENIQRIAKAAVRGVREIGP